MASSRSSEQIDARKHRIAALEHRIRELEEAVTARDSFIAVVAHELRNPMTPILGGIQRLRRMASASADVPTDLRAALEKLEWLIDRYIRRATTLLDVSRISAGKHNFSPEPIDFVQVLRAVVDGTAPAARYLQSAVSVDAPPDLCGVCDRLAFEQIAENLITNAIKYGAGRPVLVRLEATRAGIELAVEDQGPGISASDQTRIFERFERVMAHAHLAGGFGIGLWIVRQLVEAMGGSVGLYSELGRGTKFTVKLPLEAQNSQEVKKDQAS